MEGKRQKLRSWQEVRTEVCGPDSHVLIPYSPRFAVKASAAEDDIQLGSTKVSLKDPVCISAVIFSRSSHQVALADLVHTYRESRPRRLLQPRTVFRCRSVDLGQ